MDELGIEIRENNILHGWDVVNPIDWEDSIDKIPAKLALIHSEDSEALEAFRHTNKDNFREELADVIIRTLDLAYGLGFSMDSAVAEKMKKNRDREYKHGGKRL